MTVTTTLTPPDHYALGLSGPFDFVVQGINPAATAREVSIEVNSTQVFQYLNGVTTVDPAYTAITHAGETHYSVRLTPSSPATLGDVINVSALYTDSLTAATGASAEYIHAELTVKARYPGVEQATVAVNPPLTVVLEPPATFDFVKAQFYVQGQPALGEDGRPLRPDYAGRAELTDSLFILDLNARRFFDPNARIQVFAAMTITPDGTNEYVAEVPWSFHIAAPVTPLRDPGLLRTDVDRPHFSAAYEMFRRAADGCMRAPYSKASFAVLLYYGVKNSGLASLLSQVPRASSLSLERLPPTDYVSLEAAAETFTALEPFWAPLLDELVRTQSVLPERATLLNRAWRSGNAVDQVGAVCAGLLFGQALVG